MSKIATLMQQAAAGAAGEALTIEDVFSTYLYAGNGSTQTITNGIDLAGEGGLVWFKQRNGINEHQLFDTERGSNQRLLLPVTSGQTNSGTDNLVSFNADGFTVGPNNLMTGTNGTGQTYASWTFRKAPRWFDVVTYTGTGANRTVAHDLGVVPGCIIIKRTDTTGDWQVYHRSNTADPATDYLVLNSTAATVDDNTRWNDTAPTSTVFSLGTATTVNASGGTYVAYLFAHDPLGPSGDGSDGLIACGGFTSTGAEQEIDVGFEPQFVIRKVTNAVAGWAMFDNMRGFSQTNTAYLYPNLSNAEANYTGADNDKTTSRGFKFTGVNGQTHIYIAIRRGPMRAPTSGTEVFAVNQPANVARATTIPFFEAGFPPDAAIDRFNKNGSFGARFSSRLTGANYLFTDKTDAEASNAYHDYNTYMTGYYTNLGTAQGGDDVAWMFRRAPGFFDVVAYTGNGVAGRTVSHNLGVAPEMMIVKRRNDVESWPVYVGLLGNDKYLQLNGTGESKTNTLWWDSTTPTTTDFTVGNDSALNSASGTYIAYLFATLPGVSKVGSYTGNGTSQTINCGFTGGARFVLIKRTDSTGDWYVWDTVRGIVAGNDPHLSLNTTAAEVTTNDSIDPDSSGFVVNQLAATNINVSSASYIYFAVS